METQKAYRRDARDVVSLRSVSSYVNKLQLEKKAFDIAIRNVKHNKNEQIEGWKLRAEKAEQKLENPLNL
jgi:hypothetical protein